MLSKRTRSYASVNRMSSYNATDARIDNPHLPQRDLRMVVRQANEIRFRPKGKKSA